MEDKNPTPPPAQTSSVATAKSGDKRYSRFVDAAGFVVPHIPLPMLLKQCFGPSSIIIDCCTARIVTSSEKDGEAPVAATCLYATKSIKSGYLVTTVAPTFVCSNSPHIPLTRLNYQSSSTSEVAAKDSHEMTLIKRLSLFQNYRSENFFLFFTPENGSAEDQGFPSTTTSADDADVVDLTTSPRLNSSRIGFLAGEGEAAPKIKKLVDAFVDKHRTAAASVSPPTEDDIDELVCFYLDLALPGVNAVIQWMSGICVPVVVATKDIPKDAPIHVLRGIDVWVGKTCVEKKVAITVMESIVGAVKKRVNVANYVQDLVTRVAAAAAKVQLGASSSAESQ